MNILIPKGLYFRYVEQAKCVTDNLEEPPDKFALMAIEDDLLEKVVANPLHVFKMIYRSRKILVDTIMPMIEAQGPEGSKPYQTS